MTRHELEQLCQPLSPEEVLEELVQLYGERVDLLGGAGDEPLDALNACYNIIERLIENADLPPSVRVARAIF